VELDRRGTGCETTALVRAVDDDGYGYHGLADSNIHARIPWVMASTRNAARDGLERGSAYWEAGWRWIAEQRDRRATT
jgi:hypothetical protein